MPVTPLPPNNTKRYFVLYEVADLAHEFQCRVPDETGDSAAITMLQAFLLSIQDHFCLNVTFGGLEVAASGSDVRLPVSGWDNITGTGDANVTGDARANEVSFVGRGASGRKARVSFFGMLITPDGNFRLSAGDSAAISDTLAALAGTSSGFKAIDGTTVTWHQYGNYGENDHWVKVLRETD